MNAQVTFTRRIIGEPAGWPCDLASFVLRPRIIVRLMAIVIPLALVTFDARAQPRPPLSPRMPTLDSYGGTPIPTLSATDRLFVSEAVSAGTTQMSAAKLAVQKSRHSEVATYARMVMSYHEGANVRLIAAARQAGIAPPPPAATDVEYAKLNRVAPREFDAAYLDAELRAQRGLITLFERQIAGGSQEGLKAFAIESLPKLMQHHARARELAMMAASIMSTDRAARPVKVRKGNSDGQSELRGRAATSGRPVETPTRIDRERTQQAPSSAR